MSDSLANSRIVNREDLFRQVFDEDPPPGYFDRFDAAFDRARSLAENGSLRHEEAMRCANNDLDLGHLDPSTSTEEKIRSIQESTATTILVQGRRRTRMGPSG